MVTPEQIRGAKIIEIRENLYHVNKHPVNESIALDWPGAMLSLCGCRFTLSYMEMDIIINMICFESQIPYSEIKIIE